MAGVAAMRMYLADLQLQGAELIKGSNSEILAAFVLRPHFPRAAPSHAKDTKANLFL